MKSHLWDSFWKVPAVGSKSFLPMDSIFEVLVALDLLKMKVVDLNDHLLLTTIWIDPALAAVVDLNSRRISDTDSQVVDVAPSRSNSSLKKG